MAVSRVLWQAAKRSLSLKAGAATALKAGGDGGGGRGKSVVDNINEAIQVGPGREPVCVQRAKEDDRTHTS